ncbi:MAG TPA: 50S ribosomal protein L24 [Egibacteraceae bacterium]|nr:50S ribosomal protein L24 [Egibacteraceae bacterium]
MNRVRKDDTVRVISGKDAGKEGRVVRVYPKRERVMVEGVNRVTKHVRQQRTRTGAQQGGIVHEEAPIHLSNVMPVCPSCGNAVRVGSKIVSGERTRFCRKCDSEF